MGTYILTALAKSLSIDPSTENDLDTIGTSSGSHYESDGVLESPYLEIRTAVQVTANRIPVVNWTRFKRVKWLPLHMNSVAEGLLSDTKGKALGRVRIVRSNNISVGSIWVRTHRGVQSRHFYVNRFPDTEGKGYAWQ